MCQNNIYWELVVVPLGSLIEVEGVFVPALKHVFSGSVKFLIHPNIFSYSPS